MAKLQPFQQLSLLREVGITEAQTYEEPIELRLRKWKRSLVIDWILRRDDHEGRLEVIPLPVHGDAAFGHRFQQRGLRTRRGAVDLIGEHRLRENRPGTELEFRCFLVEHRDAGDIGRQQIGRALNALERAADALGERAGEHRLGDAGHVFQQNVAFAEIRNERQRDLLPLADDHLLYVRNDFARGRRYVGHAGLFLAGSGTRWTERL